MRPPFGRRRAARPQRVRIFVGCEGESEQGYVALLQRLADAAGLALHLDTVVLQPGGGDPLAIVELAVRRMTQRERQSGAPYAQRAILLDADKRGQQPQRDDRAAVIAAGEGIALIWQEPCHEALLLRHLPGCAQLRPPQTPLACQQLVQRWPDYRKPMPAARLAQRIDAASLAQIRAVEGALAGFLEAIGLLVAEGG